MTEIDLVDWTIQEVQHLKTERREPGDVKDNSAVDNLLAVLEPEPMGQIAPEGPVALIAGIPPTVEEPVARPSSAIVADTKPITGSDLPALDNLLAVLEPEPMRQIAPEGPFALIAGIPPTVEEPVARPSSAIVADTKPVTGSDLPALDNLLAVLEPEPMGQIAPEGPVALIAGIPPTVEEPVARPSSAIVADTKPITGSDLPAAAPAVSSISAETLTAEPKSALLMAIVEPDIYTARADRDRAVALRWVLRDIKSDRLKWSPVDQDDLRILIEMGLVEMRNDAAVLTDAGIRAIS